MWPLAVDVNGIELVVNYNLPDASSDYVHRIGRTGRAEKKGKAISLATPDQLKDIRAIERLINKSLTITEFSRLNKPYAQSSLRPHQGSARPHQGSAQRKRKSYGFKKTEASADTHSKKTFGSRKSRPHSFQRNTQRNTQRNNQRKFGNF